MLINILAVGDICGVPGLRPWDPAFSPAFPFSGPVPPLPMLPASL